MTGHRQVLAHRMAGRALRANALWVQTEPGVKPNTDWQRLGDFAEMAIEPADYPSLLDLRFAVGLDVRVEGTDAGRVDEVAAAFVAANAARVLTTVFRVDGYRVEAVRLTDTQGVAVWPK